MMSFVSKFQLAIIVALISLIVVGGEYYNIYLSYSQIVNSCESVRKRRKYSCLKKFLKGLKKLFNFPF